MSEVETRRVVDQLYEAFIGGDIEGMLSLMSDDVEVRFLGQVKTRGIDEARRFFAHSAGLLTDVEFERRYVVIDGSRAAVTWTETARTAAGEPWVNHGVDVFEVRAGKIVSLHENNDVRLVHQHFEMYAP